MKNIQFNRFMMVGALILGGVSLVGCSATPEVEDVVMEDTKEVETSDSTNEQPPVVGPVTKMTKEELINHVYSNETDWLSSTLKLIGKKAPNFKFKDSEGVTMSISDFKGQPLILDIMTTTCPTCQEVALELEEFKKTSDIPVISVSYNETREMLDAAYFTTDTSLISSTKADLVDMYNLQYTPSIIYIDADGVVQFTLVGSTDAETIQFVAEQVFNK